MLKNFGTKISSRSSKLTLTEPQKSTTEGLGVSGSASRVLGGRDEVGPQFKSAANERWISPSASNRDALPENSDDVNFRKVRGILNKLTPQTFDRLSDELIKIGIDSQNLIKGVILLIFEKALQEPKYVCMYAQLCKKLSKKVPNFDSPNPDLTTTFRRLLLNKCKDEYENRARIFAIYDQRIDKLSPEEEEESYIAKVKMLGNIKFIGELGKLEMLAHSILHKCCEELVKKTKAEDLECLCQIMKTCGHLLDNDKGKFLMNQYFARMKELSFNDKLPARIRFMLQDVLELRENNWLPRQTATLKESPKLIQDIWREAHDELGFQADGSKSPDDFRYLHIDPRRNRISKKNRTGMEEVFAPFPNTFSSLGTGPGVIGGSGGEKNHGIEANGYHHHTNNFRGGSGIRNYNNNINNAFNSNGNSYYAQQKNNKGQPFTDQNIFHNNARNNQTSAISYEKTAVAPRFMKQSTQVPPINSGMNIGLPTHPTNEELSLRPPPNSMIKMFNHQTIKTPYNPSLNDPSKAINNSTIINPIINNIFPAKEAPNSAKNTIEKLKPKKGPSKDDILKKTREISEEIVNDKPLAEVIEGLKDLKISEKFVGDVLTNILNTSMDRNENEQDQFAQLLIEMVKQEIATKNQLKESFKIILDLMGDLEADIPRIKSYVASFAAKSISENFMTLQEISETTEGGNHYPFLLLVLQHLGKSIEKDKLRQSFEESKINILSTLPKSDRTKDRMAEILEERELSFLFPLLKIQAEMAKQLQINSNPEAFMDWIKENVEETYYTTQEFISALITVIFKFITQETMNLGNDQPEKIIKENEKTKLLSFNPIIGKHMQGRVDLQVIALYALQAAWYMQECPKIMLLRWFMNMYELEMIEEEAFLKWKEDLCDDYPGKGNALFQVNQWLLWLEQADEEEEEDEGEQN